MEPIQQQQPLPPLVQSAIVTHELFVAYVNAGFTRDEALYLIGQMVRPPAPRDPS